MINDTDQKRLNAFIIVRQFEVLHARTSQWPVQTQVDIGPGPFKECSMD